MYEDVATLIAYADTTYDEYGNPVNETEKTEVYVKTRGVYQNEFYNAAQAGLKPSITFEISNREDYNDQKVVEYNGKYYTVIRVDWNAERDRVSLICEERTNNG